MATTALQCAQLLVGSGNWEGGCLGAAITPKCNSHETANFRPTTGDFDKALLSGGVRRSLSNSLRHRGNVLRCSGGGLCGMGVQAVEAIEKLPANVEMLEAYEIEQKVRDYELDHYGVVNNAIYAQFCQHARTELLENIGFSPDAVTETGRAMAISDMSMKFLSPLRSGDRYIVSSRVAGTTAVRLIFEDHIYRLPERELVMTARSTVVILDQNSKPGRLPDEVKFKLVNGYVTNYRGNGNSASGSIINRNSKSGHVNRKSRNNRVDDNSRTGELVNGNSTSVPVKGNGNSTNVFVEGNGNSTSDLLKGNATNVHVNGDLVNDCLNRRSPSKVPFLVA